MPELIAMNAARQAADEEARRQALEIRRSCVVEAPAGSGKTALLVQRLLKLLADPAAGVEQPEEVLAITFTNKATAELKQRTLGHLQSAQSGEPLGAAAKAFDRETRALAQAVLERSEALGWGLMEQPQRLNIRSVDSVCLQLSGALPVLTGSGAAPQPVTEADALYAAAARRTLLRLGAAGTGDGDGTDAALRTLLRHRNLNLAACEQLLAEMLGAREQWGQLVPLREPLTPGSAAEAALRAALEGALRHIVEAALERAEALLPVGALAQLASAAQRWSQLPGYTSPKGEARPNPVAMCAELPEAPQAVAEQLPHWQALIGLLMSKSEGNWRLTTRSMAVNSLGLKPSGAELQAHAEFVSSIATEPLREALGSIVALPEASYSEQQWVLIRALFRVLRHALIELQLVFAERGESDFTEFSLAARAALEASHASDAPADSPAPETAELALTAGGRLRHLLVDEMQDTSSSQYRLLELLTRSWDGASQTLFLVGDPKQSIYLFREARVERFLRIVQSGRFGSLELQTLRLTANFRSQANLVADFNADFQRILPAPVEAAEEVATAGLHEAAAAEVPFVEAFATREGAEGRRRVWHCAVQGEEPLPEGLEVPPHAEEQQVQRAAEALTIRRLIEQWLQEPLPEGRTQPWRIAVLGRTRNHLTQVLEELKRDRGRGPVGFRAVDLDKLGELPCVTDLLALTRALLHPADRIAWLAVLRAPWCGLSLADLLRLTGEGAEADGAEAAGRFGAAPWATVAELVEQRRGGLSAEGQALLARVWPVLAKARASLGQEAFSVQLESTWRSLGADLALSADELASALRYFAALRALEATGQPLTAAAVEARVSKLYAASAPAAVEVLTIHKAKGLEWDVVLVPGLERGTRADTGRLLNWLELDDPEVPSETSLVLSPINAAESALNHDPASQRLNAWLSRVRSQRQRSELRRLFYVAATRAREELHLFATAKRNKAGGLSLGSHDSLLRAVQAAAEAEFARAGEGKSSEPRVGRVIQFPAPQAEAGLALAAGAEAALAAEARPPMWVERMPREFDPAARFRGLAALPFAATAQPPSFLLDRPEGSFGVRAFGNVVHRYLQLLAVRLAAGTELATLQAELGGWTARLAASLRAEGLAPTEAATAAGRALRALTLTLGDPVGAWLLSPLAEAASERALHSATASYRVDRTFVAAGGPPGAEPGRSGEQLWIIDFKTSEPGSRPVAEFLAAQREAYAPQLQAYARLRRSLPGGELPIRLGLYYPLIPHLDHFAASESE